MNDYDFTLKFRLADAEATADQYLDALAKAGCTDAVVGVGKAGRVALIFSREATSALEAMSSAISDVHTAIPDATLIEASPDYVGVTDIAEVFDFSRQNMLKLLTRSGSAFPSPIHEGKPSIWHLVDVLHWFQAQQSRAVAADLLEIASVAMQINLFRDCARSARAPDSVFQFNVTATNSKLGAAIEPVLLRS